MRAAGKRSEKTEKALNEMYPAMLPVINPERIARWILRCHVDNSRLALKEVPRMTPISVIMPVRCVLLIIAPLKVVARAFCIPEEKASAYSAQIDCTEKRGIAESMIAL